MSNRSLRSVMLLAALSLLLPTTAQAQGGDGPGEDCFVCEGTYSCGPNGCGWVPGSIGCDEAMQGEDGNVNCMDDQLGEECTVEGYDECGAAMEDADSEDLVLLPGAGGAEPVLFRIVDVVDCSGTRVAARLSYLRVADE
jgi:hypothetical protein